MMPLTMMHPLVNEQKSSLTGSNLHWGKRYDLIARRIAREYDLPKFRVRARLIQMNYVAAKGALNYVDGSYIEPFAFDLSRGNGNYSFVLARENLFEEYENNAAFRERMDSGHYVYADGHVCLNDERYVMNTSQGLRLTPWANAHVDQCCLRFISIYESCGISDYCFGCLNSDEEYNARSLSLSLPEERRSALSCARAMSRLLLELPGSFSGTLRAHMTRQGMTIERLSEKTGISVRSINRLRNEERASYALEQVILIALALHLPPEFSLDLIEKAGLRLRSWPEELIYGAVLRTMYKEPLDAIQEALHECGGPELKIREAL